MPERWRQDDSSRGKRAAAKAEDRGSLGDSPVYKSFDHWLEVHIRRPDSG